ncbi:MAG: 16S rRNA (cytidine(1402)-2'-O)-methyltransferase [Alphaproteobacteria bacterium]
MPHDSSFIKGLYLVATPIGNLGDISARAIDVLAHADVVACEDTRVTAKLFSLLGISAPLTPYHEHNADKVRPHLIERLKNGEMIALVSDAGTPLVNDPGYRLVQDCVNEGIYVTAVPGASAVLTALQLSGLPCHRFLFSGFLPVRTAARQKELAELAAVPATLIFYEAPQRIEETLADARAVLGDRKAALARELTKKFEQTIRGTLSELMSYYKENGPLKGEFVLLIAPPDKNEKPDMDSLTASLREALKTMSLKDAVARTAVATGLNKKQIYELALAIKNEGK